MLQCHHQFFIYNNRRISYCANQQSWTTWATFTVQLLKIKKRKSSWLFTVQFKCDRRPTDVWTVSSPEMWSVCTDVASHTSHFTDVNVDAAPVSVYWFDKLYYVISLYYIFEVVMTKWSQEDFSFSPWTNSITMLYHACFINCVIWACRAPPPPAENCDICSSSKM